ncbi:PREDICTED: bidirectional sugar transporter [Prunus dulcis]|uniref:PREDICTED: bidirectional sugar transporter n=1 Tax=Prunus dulcis TaxID=3755 RepID=A0A5E4EA31_PRUDU|nr:PREDICTED: bidirectional sugar transporter [Prunus dulcis]
MKSNEQLAFIFGLIGNIVSVMVFLAPIPTFYKIYKNKSSEGFQSTPYVVALLSAMLLLFYGVLKTNAALIISINVVGCVIEITYLIFYFVYASKKDKITTMIQILVLNVAAFGSVVAVTFLLVGEDKRVSTVGWICAVFGIAVFAAPLLIMVIFVQINFQKFCITRKVIQTKSVEYMPFYLSFSLTICATLWFFLRMSATSSSRNSTTAAYSSFLLHN